MLIAFACKNFVITVSYLCRRIPYIVATKYKHEACAALLNPSAPEPLTWPSRLKFINELNSEAKALLEKALIMANKEREKAILKETSNTLLPTSNFSCIDDDIEVPNFATYFRVSIHTLIA